VGYDYKPLKYLPFQQLSRRILSKNIDDVSDITVNVKIFDLMYLNGETLIDLPYETRRKKLNALMLNRPLKQSIHFDIEKVKEIK